MPVDCQNCHKKHHHIHLDLFHSVQPVMSHLSKDHQQDKRRNIRADGTQGYIMRKEKYDDENTTAQIRNILQSTARIIPTEAATPFFLL